MKLLYDGYVYTLQRHGGINRVFAELLPRLQRMSPELEISTFRFPDPVGNLNQLYFVPKVGRLLRGWDSLVLKAVVKRTRPDIYHPTYYRFMEVPTSKFVITVYDMIHEKFLQGRPGSANVISEKRKCVERADVVIAISEATKKDIVEIYGLKPEKVTVVHLAASDAFSQPVDDSALKQSQQVPERFALFVGQRGGYKNFQVMLEAYALVQQKLDLALVCVGGGPWSSAETALIAKLKLTRVLGYQNASDDFLKLLYSRSRFFVYPSAYEGFGIPLLEAMAMGTPVISSTSSSLPEIAGDAADYFDPLSVEQLAERMNVIDSDDHRRKTLIQNGYQRAKNFSWQITARKTLDIYQALAS